MSLWNLLGIKTADDAKRVARFVKSSEFNSGRGREPGRSATKRYAWTKYRHAKRSCKWRRRALRRRWKEWSMKRRGRFGAYWVACQERKRK